MVSQSWTPTFEPSTQTHLKPLRVRVMIEGQSIDLSETVCAWRSQSTGQSNLSTNRPTALTGVHQPIDQLHSPNLSTNRLTALTCPGKRLSVTVKMRNTCNIEKQEEKRFASDAWTDRPQKPAQPASTVASGCSRDPFGHTQWQKELRARLRGEPMRRSPRSKYVNCRKLLKVLPATRSRICRMAVARRLRR